MRARTKALLLAAAIGGTAVYGHYRFHASRYEPQCETIPGVCVYGNAPVSSAVEIRVDGRNVTRWLDLTFSGGRATLVGIYEPGQRMPGRVNIRAGEESKVD